MDRLSSDTDGLDLSVYAAGLRRRWWVVLLGVLVGLGLAVVFTRSQTVSYRSTAAVLVTATGLTDAADANRAINLDTEVQLVRSEAVAQAARMLLNTSTPAGELTRGVDVFIPPNTRVLEISYVATSAEGAQQGAHAFAQAYIETRSAAARNAVTREIDALQAELTGLQQSLQEVSGQVAALPSTSPDRAFADAQRSVLINQISGLQSRISPLRTASTSGGEIINDAELPLRPSSPIPQLNYGSGLLAGLLLGVVLAVFLDRANGRIASARDVETWLRLPVVAEVPRARRKAALAIARAASPPGQAYAELRNGVMTAVPPGQRVVVVTAASSGPSGGLVSANFASSLERAGQSVALIVADGASPSASLLGVPADPGLAEVLRGKAEVAEVVHKVSSDLMVCPPGVDVAEESERLQSAAMAGAVEVLRAAVDYVVIDAPSVASGAQAQSLARLADVALIVAEAGRSTREGVAHAARQLDRMGARSLGVVVVPDVRRRRIGTAGEQAEAVGPRSAALSEA